MLTLAEMKEQLGVEDSDSDSDGLIWGIYERAKADAEQLLSVHLGFPEETALYLDGSGSRSIRLTQAPAATPAPVIERETSAGVWEVIPVTDYQIIGKELRHDSGWLSGVGNYRITYTRGYEEGDQDPFYQRARQAVLDLVGMRYRGIGKEGMQSETIGDYSYTLKSNTFSSQLPDSLIRLRGLVYS